LRIVVTGPRQWEDYQALESGLRQVVMEVERPLIAITLTEGEADGFDLMSKEIAESFGWGVHPVPALWRPGGIYDPKAGFARNEKMMKEGHDICVAGIMACEKKGCAIDRSHHSHGTANAIRWARSEGIPLRKVYPS